VEIEKWYEKPCRKTLPIDACNYMNKGKKNVQILIEVVKEEVLCKTV